MNISKMISLVFLFGLIAVLHSASAVEEDEDKNDPTKVAYCNRFKNENITTLELGFDGQQLESIPQCVFAKEFEKLNSLSLKANKLTNLDGISRLQSLTTLSVSDNAFDSIPSEIWNMRNLISLDMSKNKFSELPDDVGNLVNLQRITLNENGMKELPGAVSQLKKLNTITIESNKFEEFPEVILGLNLTHLFIRRNSITELPANITSFKALESLFISHNKLEKIPENLSDLKTLLVLGLDGLELKEYPQFSSKFEKLQGIHLRENKFETIPKEIYEIDGLRFLYMENNPLEKPIMLKYEEFKFLTALEDMILPSQTIESCPKDSIRLLLTEKTNACVTDAPADVTEAPVADAGDSADGTDSNGDSSKNPDNSFAFETSVSMRVLMMVLCNVALAAWTF